jgi:uncharacterized membrane protein YccC
MISTLLTFFIVGLVALVGISILLAVVGAVFGLAMGLVGFLLFKVAPVILVGYLLIRFLAPRSRRLSPADREWLES